MAPSVASGRKHAAGRDGGDPATASTGAGASPPSAVPVLPAVPREPHVATLPPEILAKLREIRAFVRANAEDVGGRFAEEARKIHYDEAEARPIVGQATRADALELLEEGIAVMPLPALPEERN